MHPRIELDAIGGNNEGVTNRRMKTFPRLLIISLRRESAFVIQAERMV
jgi:hypothetical protein